MSKRIVDIILLNGSLKSYISHSPFQVLSWKPCTDQRATPLTAALSLCRNLDPSSVGVSGEVGDATLAVVSCVPLRMGLVTGVSSLEVAEFGAVIW